MNTKFDLGETTHHPAIAEIVEVMCNKTQNTDRGFFQTEVAYFLGKIASNMRALIVTKDRGEIPINIYALALATSGFGKGHSVNVMENEFLIGYRRRFMEETLPTIAEKHIWELAHSRSARNGTDLEEEQEKLTNEYLKAGEFPFTFDSGTAPAVKQLRHKLLLANCGAVNLQIDEIGSNLLSNIEVLTLYLELYDQGLAKQKLTKNTSENVRAEEIIGKTPANMLLFGTPTKLLDGGQSEEQFYSFLETGYARRCLFGYGKQDRRAFNSQSAEEIYRRLINPSNSQNILKWATRFEQLADPALYGWKVQVEDEVAIRLIEYKVFCEQQAELLADHEEVRKSELSHRYFKALKLAGAYAFIDQTPELTMEQLHQAILLVEESGEAFQTILNREKTYVKLAKYIASVDTEVTHADLLEALPFYKSGIAARNELISLATAWGYKKHILIKKTFIDGIEFFRGETLQETDLSAVQVAYSDHYAYNYVAEQVPFDQLHVLTQAEGMHWANHRFRNNHRLEENVIAGFNLLVLDIDQGVSLATAQELLREYKFLTYTTKRHTEEANRFRLILPINYTLELDADDYKEFMTNILDWLPFPSDEQANQRARKWESCAQGQYHYNLEGQVLDVLPFIPKTSKNEQYRQNYQKVQSLDNLERWFAQRMVEGNRNNHMLRFALALADSGLSLNEVAQQVHGFNKKLAHGLDPDEIDRTVLTTVAKRYGPA